jgi:hypothetical protein
MRKLIQHKFNISEGDSKLILQIITEKASQADLSSLKSLQMKIANSEKKSLNEAVKYLGQSKARVQGCVE